MKRMPSSSPLSSSSSFTSNNSSPSLPLYIPLISISSFSKIYCALLQQKILLHLLLLLLQMTTGVLSVRVHDVRVPTVAIVGQPAKLECDWDSGKNDFYSVRWYMDDEQFYSFILGNKPEKVDHNLPGIYVALRYSDQTVVTLSEVTPAAEGKYRCEVMSEAPFFQTSFASANLTVVDLPDDPEIYGVKDRYRVGDTLNVSCTARNSRPPAALFFHVNGRRVHPDSGRVRELGVAEGSYREVYTTTSQLILPLSNRHAPTLTLTCHAHVLSTSVETSTVTQVDPARTTMLSFFNTGVSCNTSTPHTMLLTALMMMLLLLCYPW